ncbi:MAG: 2-hydroxyacyl-CoA dehydratase [Candidatus Helarchaeota archaeon]
MSIDAEEFLIPSFLNLNLKFFSAEKQIRKFRRNKRPLVGTILPIGAELVFAAGASPIFPLRIGKFEAEKLLRGTRLATNILGSSLVSAGTRIMQPQADAIIDQFLREYNKNLCDYEVGADTLNYFPEACFATRIAYGSSLPHRDYIQLFMAWGTRCEWFSQFYQTLNEYIPIIFTDIPMRNAPHGKEYMYEELLKFNTQLESLTGQEVTEEVLKEKLILANEIRENYRQVLYYLKDPKRMPLSPYAYMQLLALLNISFIDYLSAIKYFNKQFTKLVKELNRRRTIDYSDVPKILLVPVFSGSEPDLPQIMNDLGGCLIQADNLAYGMLNPIKTQGDLLQNYGDYLLEMHHLWSGSQSVVNSWLKMAEDLHVDGIVFNHLVGCTSLSPAYRIFKDAVVELGIPSTVINFNRIGENLAQLKNKLASFLEVVRNS